jgi:hypothetical protein
VRKEGTRFMKLLSLFWRFYMIFAAELLAFFFGELAREFTS